MDYKDYNLKVKSLALMRARAVLDMRATGKTWDEIGKALGVSRQRAHQIAQKANEPCEELGGE